jgi:hypothetical protein
MTTVSSYRAKGVRKQLVINWHRMEADVTARISS